MYCQLCELAEHGGCYPAKLNEDGLLSHVTESGEEPCLADNSTHSSDCAHWVGEPCDCVVGKDSQ